MRKYLTATLAATFLFILAVLPILLRVSGLDVAEGFLPALSALVLDCSGFLTVLCAIVAVYCLFKRAGLLATSYLLDIVLINRLYLNENWPVFFSLLKDFFGSLKGRYILIYAFLGIMAFFVLQALWRSFRSARATSDSSLGQASDPMLNQESTGGAPSKLDSAVSTQAGSEPVQPDSRTDTEYGGQSTGQPEKLDDRKQRKRPGLTATNLLIGLFVGGISAFAASILLQRTLGQEPPPGLEWLFQEMFPLAVLCTGGLICLLTIRAISSGSLAEGGMRGTALLSLITEIAIIAALAFTDGNLDSHIVDNILNLISSNELVALVVAPVLLFIVLDVVFSILLKMVSRNPGPVWLSDSKEKLVSIEKGLMDLVLNLIIGFMNLLLFIPDFFNQIGFLMLGEDTFFPQSRISTAPKNSGNREADKSAANQMGNGTSGKENTGKPDAASESGNCTGKEDVQ